MTPLIYVIWAIYSFIITVAFLSFLGSCWFFRRNPGRASLIILCSLAVMSGVFYRMYMEVSTWGYPFEKDHHVDYENH